MIFNQQYLQKLQQQQEQTRQSQQLQLQGEQFSSAATAKSVTTRAAAIAATKNVAASTLE